MESNSEIQTVDLPADERTEAPESVENVVETGETDGQQRHRKPL